MLPSLTPSQTRMSRSREKNSAGFGGRAHVRLADDLDERDAAAVVVDVGAAIGIGKPFVQRLARVLFHVDARQADVFSAAGRDVEAAAERQRPLVLRNLVALRQVRIEVVLPREDRCRLDVAAERERRLDRVVHRLAIEHRQRARQPQAHRTHLRVRRGAERRAAAAEDLRAGRELCVDFEPDDRLERHATVGPASFTDGETSWANVLKFSANMRASFFACSSYARGVGPGVARIEHAGRARRDRSTGMSTLKTGCLRVAHAIELAGEGRGNHRARVRDAPCACRRRTDRRSSRC